MSTEVTLDLETLLIASATVNVVIVMIMAYTRFARRTYPGFNAWLIGFVSNIAAQIALANSGLPVPSFLSVFGFVLLVGLPFFGWYGLRQFLSLPVPRWSIAVVFGTSTVLFSIIKMLNGSVLLYAALASFISIMFCLWSLRDMRKYMHRVISGSCALLFWTVIIIAIVICVRFGLVAIESPVEQEMLQPHPSNKITILALISSRILLMSAFIMLTQQRLEEELVQAKGALATANAQLSRVNATLLVESREDGLTGLSNRRKFDEMLETEWLRLAREKKPLSVIMIDVDFFKRFNDHYGHTAGDDCLKVVAAAIKMVAQRSTDLRARIGGEEFAFLLPDTLEQGALEIAHQVQSRIRALKYPHAASLIGDHLTVSIGLHTLYPTHDGDSVELVKLADMALYHSKRLGRNHITAWSKELSVQDGAVTN